MSADNDEAICTACWVNTENFHVFYESIKNAQNCYSSDEDDHGNNGLLIEQHQLVQQVEVLNSGQLESHNGIVITQNYTIHDEYESVGKHLDGSNEMSMDMMMLVEDQEPMTYVEEIIQAPDHMQMIGPIATIRERTISISSGEGPGSGNSQNVEGKNDLLLFCRITFCISYLCTFFRSTKR